MKTKKLIRTRRVLKYAALVFVIAFFVGPFVWSAAAGTSCFDWTRRDHHQPEIDTTEVLELAANSDTLSVPLLPAGLEGLALPAFGVTLTVGDPGTSLLVHEATHHLQAAHDGQIEFAARYTAEFVAGLYSGCGPYDSYLQIGYEKQARYIAHISQYNLDSALGSVAENRPPGGYLAAAVASAVSETVREEK